MEIRAVSSAERTPLLTHRYIPLPYACTAFGPHQRGFAAVSNGKIAAQIDLTTGTSTPIAGHYARARRDPATRLHGLRESMVERADGPWTRICDSTGRE